MVSRLDRPNPPCAKKRKKFLRSFDPQPFSADLQQSFAADFLSRSSQQIFSADFLSKSSQQIFSADLLMLWSGVGGQLLSYHFGGLYSANLRSRFSQQIFSADFLSRSSQHLLSIFSADLLSRSFAVVRGWWSAIVLSFAVVRGWWSAIVSGVGGQLLSYHFGGLYCMSSLEGPFRGAFGKNLSPL